MYTNVYDNVYNIVYNFVYKRRPFCRSSWRRRFQGSDQDMNYVHNDENTYSTRRLYIL